jgi:DNA-binding transcriptional regulator YhcF (GntR family)
MTRTVGEFSAPPLSTASLTAQIADSVRQQIRTGVWQAGDRLPGVRELAGQYGVCKHSVSTALEVLAREGLIEKRQGRGVHVAHRTHPWRIGLLSEMDLLDTRIGPYFRLLAGVVKRALQAVGAVPSLYVGNLAPPGVSDDPTCPQFWADIAAGRLDGGVLLDVPSSDQWRARVRECPLPLVGWSTSVETEIDHAGMIAAAVQRLAAGGRRRLGLLADGHADVFRQAVQACGGYTTEAWIHAELHPARRGGGATAFQALWAGPEKPDGLIILDDMLFADAQLAMLGLGVRSPRDLQLAVHVTDDAYPVTPYPYTALVVQAEEEAGILVEHLLRKLRGEVVAPGMHRLTFRLREMAAGSEHMHLAVGA